MAFYTKKPITIEAIQWDGDIEKANSFLGEAFGVDWRFCENSNDIVIPTLEGEMICWIGNYLIKGVEGEFYPCRKDIFEKTYDLRKEDENRE